ncbi:transcription factor subunit Med10 of mediator complex-domain-containing protein [Fennellomyces sp. T-0311]|nr:transcription factor subunit Med10 of mediator complex-domain-containing protein [Fennellomyces sp. T-0311]
MQQTDSRSSSGSSSAPTPTNQGESSQANSNASKAARRALEEQLNDLLQILFELSVMVYDFQPDGNQLVWNKINTILEHYQKIDELKDSIDTYIPEEVINFVEHGRNPDIFTQGFVERAASENQFTYGKIKAVDDFKSILSDEFAKHYPELYENKDQYELPRNEEP